MLELDKDIDSLSNFKRHTAEFLQRIKASGRPVILTVAGKAEVVVQDAAAYQRLLELAEQLESLDRLQQSLEDVDKGRTRPLREALQDLGGEP